MDVSTYNIYIDKGTPWQFLFSLADLSDQTLNFTGYTVRCQIRKPDGALVASPTASITSGGLISLGLTASQVTLIPTTNFSMNTYDVYEYNVILDPPTTVLPSMAVLEGLVYLRGGVTR